MFLVTLRGRIAYGLLGLTLAMWAAGPAAAGPKGGTPKASGEHDPYVLILAAQNISPDSQGIGGYFRSLKLNDRDRQEIGSLLNQLFSDDYDSRDAATRQLTQRNVVPAQDLREATRSEVVELRVRARQVLAARSAGNGNSSVAIACFRTIAHKRIGGMTAQLLDVLPLYCEEFVQAAGREAIKATASREDLPLLRRAAASGPVEARTAAIGALGYLLGTEPCPEIHRALNDSEPRVRLAAALALAHHGDRACLAPLVALLSCDEPRVRQISANTLRSLTGRHSDYVAWVNPDEQAQSIQAWMAWLASSGSSARLHTPLRTPEVELGRTLICLYARNEVREVDAAGRETFTTSESGGCPWACHGLPNGNRLVAMYSTNLIIEYSADGREQNRISIPGGPMSVQRLENGNTLVACNNAQKIVEVNDQGKVAWEMDTPGGPCDAQRLENGNTLVTLQNTNQVVELDATGHEIWKLEDLHTPRTAQRLDNGDTLVCDLGSGRVVEFDSAGREVWSHDGFSSPFGAQRLVSGTTLVSDTESVKEIDHAGKVIWESKQPSLGRVWRY